jgi:hypothetical protein
LAERPDHLGVARTQEYLDSLDALRVCVVTLGVVQRPGALLRPRREGPRHRAPEARDERSAPNWCLMLSLLWRWLIQRAQMSNGKKSKFAKTEIPKIANRKNRNLKNFRHNLFTRSITKLFPARSHS